MSRQSTETDVLTLAAATWLACGIVLLGLTPLPLHDASLGWSLPFWLLVAPGLLLVARRVFTPGRDASARRKARSIQHVNAPTIRRRKTTTSPGVRTRPTRRTAA
ncbi:MAG: hypothetical protein OJF55_001974 [Rhodanobacteraceae bacterium]|jgi:hypothetical protein|nr:MAG: hypothetical protein OJF55_001974 [Rhodanobacteraceae bacterium]